MSETKSIRLLGHAQKIVSENPYGYKVICSCGWKARGYEAIFWAKYAHEQHKAKVIAKKAKMSNIGKTRVPGHELPFEGKVAVLYRFVNGSGRTRCSCGLQSPDLPSTAARKRWHREHKAQVIAERSNA